MINNCTAGFIKSGKLNMIIDGQFGSTGKGLISAKIAVTKRVRRVFTFSKDQYIRSLKLIKPTHIFLNFINYIREEDLNLFQFTKIQKPNYVGYNPYANQVIPYGPFILDNYLYSFK